MVSSETKVIKSFTIVGLNPNIVELEPTITINDEIYIKRIDIIKSKIETDQTSIDKSKYEKWLKINKDSDYWMRILYTSSYNKNDPPITSIKYIKCIELNSDYIVRILLRLLEQMILKITLL